MPNTIAVLTDALEQLSLTEALSWCAGHGAAGVELGVGGYSPAPHVDRRALLVDAGARAQLAAQAAAAGVEIVALNASGNPLHPNPDVAADHAQALRDAIELAQALEVDRVVAMSGCPGGPGPDGAGSWPVFAGGAWLPDMEGLWERQFERVIAPFWRELSNWAAVAAPDVRICLELHPGTSIYNADSFACLRSVTGENVAVNLDPSHFWWQGIDPLVTIAALGDTVAFVHGKDTLLHPDRIARGGVLDFRWPAAAETMPWHFCAVGAGRSIAEWSALLDGLAAAGYDGPISVEHEDPNLDPQSGIAASIAGLQAALAGRASATTTPPSTIHVEQRSA